VVAAQAARRAARLPTHQLLPISWLLQGVQPAVPHACP
jgi:hypothetical protein